LRAAVSLATDFPSLGSSIDLNRVQTIMESMGSKLSPGAQQLMDMVRFQQKVNEHPVDGLHGATIQTSLDLSPTEPLPIINCLSSETVYEDLKINLDLNTQIPERENPSDSGALTTQQNMLDPRNDFKVLGSLLTQEQTSENPNTANLRELLPFLQNLCHQVNHLRLKDGNKHFEKNVVTKEEAVQSVG
uniref:Uncharacterized protein n=1 Tax=Dromaius novaehollandiae TaxID=8790 RepID=A0A8C4JVX1_DRONO